MAEVGNLTRTETESGVGVYSGMISVLKGDFRTTIIKHPRAGNDNAPTHQIFFLLNNGERRLAVGVAWERKLQRGDHAGRDMLSINIDHPELPDWMGNIAAFPANEEGGYSVVHGRQGEKAS